MENWNCATVNALRELCGDVGWRGDNPAEINGRQQAFGIRWDDESWGAVNVIGVETSQGHYKTLWMSWYKNRGRTDDMLLLCDGMADVPNMADCEAILTHFENR